MMRFITPIIVIILAVALFFMFTNPIYSGISSLRAEIASYNSALDNSKALETERDKLTTKYNAMSPDSISRLEKFLPDNVDNIRLILEIEQIASPYGMVLNNVKYSVADSGSSTASAPGGAVINVIPKNYGIFNLEFSTSGTYSNFVNFTKDLEDNLRIVDISSISFASNTPSNTKTNSPEVYTYDFKIKTYWLKN